MIDRVRIVGGTDIDGHDGEGFGLSELDISMYDPSSDIVVADITGLGPAVSTVNLFKKAAIPGAEYVSKTVPEKNIVVMLELPKSTRSVDERRDEIYTALQRHSRITLVFYKDSNAVNEESRKVYSIQGYVESVEPVHFTKEPTVQISVICPIPYFVLHPVINELTPFMGFAFPESIPYSGTVVNGFEIEVKVDPNAVPISGVHGGVITFSQYVEETDFWRGLSLDGNDIKETGPFSVPGNFGWVPGDKVTINTTPGNKSATLVRDGSTRSILSAIRNDDGSYMRGKDWPVLYPHALDQTWFYASAYSYTDLEITYRWQNLVDGI